MQPRHADMKAVHIFFIFYALFFVVEIVFLFLSKGFAGRIKWGTSFAATSFLFILKTGLPYIDDTPLFIVSFKKGNGTATPM